MPIDPRMVKWETTATPDDIAAIVADEAQRQGVPVDLALSLMRTESAGKQSALSPKGAIGPMQLMPATAKELGVDPNDPVQNVRGGVMYLKQQLDRFGKPEFALAAYNAGPGAVARAGGVPNIPETQAYVPKVMEGASKRTAIDPRMVRWEEVQAPAEQASTPDKTTFLDSVLRGARDPIDKFSQLAARALTATGIEGDYIKRNVDTDVAKRLQEYEAARGGNKGFDWGRLLGNVAATAPLAAVMPGAAAPSLLARTASSAASGGALGALQPVDTGKGDFWGETGKGAAGGAVGGAVAAPLTTAVGRVLSPQTGEGVRTLMREGVTPTPGQVLGGAFKSAEEKMSSVPILGSAIRSGQQRAVEQFDRAAVNRALFPVGKSLPKGVQGRDAIQFADDTLGTVYDDVLSRVGAPKVDNQFLDELVNIRFMLRNQPKDLAERVDTIIENEILDRTENGRIVSDAIKKAESNLGRLGSELRRNPDTDKGELGNAVLAVQQSLREWLARTAPQEVANDLRKANLAWANFKRVERAAGSVAAENGVFSPAQLHNAVKALDRTKDKGGFARGTALMQDLSEAGKSTLTNKVPNSGTADRALAASLTLGPLMGGGISPALPLAAIPSAMYAPGVQRGVAGLLASRPDVMRALGNRLPFITPGLTAALAPAGYGLLGE